MRIGRRIGSLAFLVPLVGLPAGSAYAGVMYEIVSGGTSSTSSIQNQSATVTLATGFSKGSGLDFSTGSTFNVDGFDITNASFADAIADSEFISWSFTFASPQDLETFSVRLDRSPTGPNQVQIELDTGSGYSTVFTDTSLSDSGETTLGISLSTFDAVTSGTFRLSAFGATSNSGSLDFENATAIATPAASFQLNAVPEPGTAAVLGGLGLLTLVRRRRRVRPR